jgi:hypothetical protein
MQEEITLPEAAKRAGLTWPQAQRRLTRGDFGPSRQIAGRWLVTASGVAEYIERRKQAVAGPTQPACPV